MIIVSKKKKEPIVLNHTELTPTTLGSVEEKKNNPLFVIILIIALSIMIIFLDKITAFVNTFLNPSTVASTPASTTNNKTNTDTTDDSTTDTTKYYTISDSLSLDEKSLTFNNFKVDTTAKTISFTITNNGGSEKLLSANNYYLELYSEDSKLLQRIKLDNDVITDSKDYTYDVTTALKLGTINKLTLTLKELADYPNVQLLTNASKTPYLTCTKNTTSIVYYFTTNKKEEYLLSSEEVTIKFSTTSSTYSNDLKEYTTLAASYNALGGVTADLNPITSGFTFVVTIKLDTITDSIYSSYFKDKYYYAKDVQAKQISFELEASGYECS